MAALIPCDKFIEVLNSGTWTDRNKAEFVIDRLCQQDPKLLAKVEANAVQSLAEMACWDQPHAGSARRLLAKACRLPEDKLDRLFGANDIVGVVKACKGTSASSGVAPPAPSQPAPSRWER